MGGDCGHVEDCKCIALQLTCGSESEVADLRADGAHFDPAMMEVVVTYVDVDF